MVLREVDLAAEAVTAVVMVGLAIIVGTAALAIAAVIAIIAALIWIVRRARDGYRQRL